MTDAIEQMLAERGERYGDFTSHARIAQALKRHMHQTEGWSKLQPMQQEALDMIQHKVARILNGDPNWADSWIDVVGYAQLVVDRLDR